MRLLESRPLSGYQRALRTGLDKALRWPYNALGFLGWPYHAIRGPYFGLLEEPIKLTEGPIRR